MDEEKDNSKNKLYIIIGIVIVVLCLGFFILYKTVLDKPKEEKKEEKSVNEQTLEKYPYLQVVTALYGEDPESNDFINNLFGENAEEKFKTYFQWLNVVHELGHGLIIYNANGSYDDHIKSYNISGYLEEQKVNDFAVAYWKTYGDPEKLQLIKETVDYILSNMTDPTGGTLTLEEYGKTLWESGNPDSTFEAYGWFQFNSVKIALEKDLTLEDAIKNMGIDKKIVLDDEKLRYGTIDQEVCDKIILDTVAKFKKWGLIYPEVFHVYDTDPNINYSNPITKQQYDLFNRE